jgi:glycosyltransferase involved in cell wall biosynthesis
VSDSALPDPSPTTPSKRDPLRLLAYVHLRNIHESTGSGRVARQMVEHLALRDDVKLRILADAADQRRILPLVGEPWTNFEYATFANDTSRQQARWLAMERPRAESYWPEADVVFCTGESYVPKRKARLAVTLHDAAYFEEGAHRTDRSFRLQQLKWRILFHRLSRRADMFHTVSQFSANRLSHFFPKMASRMRVVHNGVAPHFFEEVKEAGEDFLVEKKLNGRQYVLVPGGLHYRKNAELILRAAPMLLERFPDLVLAVVNHSNAAYAEQAHALSERVRLLGFVSEEALHSLYAAATVVWFPSRYEGFGLPVVEAMACGAPVVASDASSIPEVAGKAALLVHPDDAGAHVEAIKSLLDSVGQREAMFEAGRQRAREFTWAAAAARLRLALGELV